MMLTLITGPTADILSLTEAKEHLRVDDTDSDTYITELVSVVTQMLDGRSGTLGRALMTQTWELALEEFEDDIRLPLPPLQSVTSVKYYDVNNTLQTLATSVYTVLSDDLGSFIEVVIGQHWPVIYPRDDAVVIKYVCGYGAAADVPAPIKHAAKVLLAGFYENRTEYTDGPSSHVVQTVEAVTAPYRRVWG